MPQPVSAINVYSQVGQESAIGGGGPAGTRLRSLRIAPGDEVVIRDIMTAGHRFDTGSVVDKRWSSLDVSEETMLYTEHLYCLENLFGAATLTSPGTATKKRVYNAALTGSITPKTWSGQWGDPADNVNAYAYGLLTDYGETWDRESGVKLTGGKGLAQIVTTGATFTATPKLLAEVAIAAGDFNIYLDTSWANLGNTQITDEIDAINWALNGMKDVRWTANRANASFGGHKEMRPKSSLKFTIYENGTARPIIASLETGGIYFLRLDGQSSIMIDNYFVVTLGGPSAGTFTLTYKGQTTAGIAYNAAASAVQSALQALSTIGAGNVTVTGGAGGPYTVTMAGTLANDSTVMTGSGTGLTGGAFTIVGTQLPYLARRDFCCKLEKVSPLKDTKGIYGREISLSLKEDATSGNALVLTSQTAEATL